jgi:CubicO group peptidase (beta-lactamase class C family)
MPAGVWVDDDRLEQAFRRVGEVVAGGEPPAAALAVGLGDRVLGVRAFGAPDHPSVDDASRFPLASISKPIVATAVLQLVDDGLLRLGEPLALHLPELAAADPGKADITAWHVLTHTSGLTEVDWPTALAARADAPLGFEEACRRPLAFAPGTAYLYSSLSFYLLGEVVARLGGPSLEGYLERRVFAPLGVTSVTLDPRGDPPRAVPIGGITAGVDVSAPAATDYFIRLALPGGGFWGTAADVLRFGQGLLRVARTGRGGVLSPAALELMTRDHTGRIPFLVHADGLQVHRALGWGTATRGGMRLLPGSARVFEHDGVTGGTLWIDPEWDLVVVFLAGSFVAPTSVRRSALQLVYSALVRG